MQLRLYVRKILKYTRICFSFGIRILIRNEAWPSRGEDESIDNRCKRIDSSP